MAHIPSDDVKQLFDENKQKNWSGFGSILRQRKGKAEGIEDSVIDSLIMLTQRFEQSKEPYPVSSEQLQRVLDNELTKVIA